ncbi:hypothetical protein [Sphingomonas antarctica]|uniref:hypothetical protein n=1 Tax=Sphingomonas antarctica TaxID=2040274 RepID=UPI0039E9E1D9
MTERADIDFYDVVLRPDPGRTVVRPFEPGYPTGFDDGATRTQEVVDLILGLDEAELNRQLVGVTHSLDENHRDVDATLLRRFSEIASSIPGSERFEPAQQRSIGAYFSQEYACETAALFNPSVVLHPDQADVAQGSVRFLLSLRGIGEGHVSSVTFRTGVWTPGGALDLPPSEWSKINVILGHEGDWECHRRSTSRRRSSASCVRRRSFWRRAGPQRRRLAGSQSASRLTTAGARNMAV